MKTSVIAISLAIALILPVAGQAASNCGVPQGYGTNNSHTFNRSTCGFGDNSYNVPNAAKDASGAAKKTQGVSGSNLPASSGASNSQVPESDDANLNSDAAGD